LSQIIRDADQLDMLGAIGIMRAFTSKSDWTPYDPQIPKGSTWQKNNLYFNHLRDNKIPIGTTIIDQINYQISRFQNLNTKAAKKFGRPLVIYMKKFVIQLAAETQSKK